MADLEQDVRDAIEMLADLGKTPEQVIADLRVKAASLQVDSPVWRETVKGIGFFQAVRRNIDAGCYVSADHGNS